ncbi:FAD-dependent oxidoreductase [Rufibacter sediminis]|uniref:FAD-dependent oxidoreductase n=1 Tax=Rufibacter sediminis TaxID=2762756 RepID=A0ABR6VQ24_9BACT|nr:FAD-dependent oxidoreductase [Rufibacter sediminis]MBC3539296.1 FAD-dependent oxidoreductase [Rufibacter sediminis]
MKTTSIWRQDAQASNYPRLQGDLTTDVVVIGGGITGITTAHLLAAAGKRVVVLEALKVAESTTGYSTGNLYATVGSYLSVMEKKYDQETVRALTSSRSAAIDLIESLVQRYSINCHFKRIPFYLLTEYEAENAFIQAEVETAQKAGLPAYLDEARTPLPFPVSAAMRLENQAQFNPMAYVKELAAHTAGPNCHIFEHTKVLYVEDGSPNVVHTEHGKVRAQQVIHATHTPKGIWFLHTLLGPYREYALAVSLNSAYPEGTFWDYHGMHHHSMRTYANDQGDPYLLILGEPHKVGHKEDNEEAFQKLERYVRERFDVKEVEYRWAAQQYKPADHLPYIGRKHSGSNIYVATGFEADGLTFGTLSAMILSDLILGNENQWAEMYSPTRHQPMKAAPKFIKENVDVMAQYLKDLPYRSQVEELADVRIGEGKNIEMDGKNYGAYRDDTGKLHVVSAVCTHMACLVHFNKAEKSWDCPCHGSRFDVDGHVLEGPAYLDLSKMEDKPSSSNRFKKMTSVAFFAASALAGVYFLRKAWKGTDTSKFKRMRKRF